MFLALGSTPRNESLVTSLIFYLPSRVRERFVPRTKSNSLLDAFSSLNAQGLWNVTRSNCPGHLSLLGASASHMFKVLCPPQGIRYHLGSFELPLSHQDNGSLPGLWSIFVPPWST
eukprot:Gb_30898 [translate_table: standard]